MIDIGNKTVYMGGAMPEEKGTSGSGLELLDTLESFNLNFIPGGVTPEEWATVYGPSPLLLPKAKANSLQYVKAFGGTEQRNLPEGYTQVEYIESNGTQYIDTSVYISTGYKVRVKAYATSVPTSIAFFGCTTTADPNNAHKGIFRIIGASINRCAWGNGSGSIVGSLTGNDSANTWYDMVCDNGVWTINDTLFATCPESSFTSEYSMWLFARNTGGIVRLPASCRISVCQIWDNNGQMIRNLVPCKNASNVVGMYDLVNGVFYQNAGTGDFVAGDAAVPTPDAPMDIVSNNGVLKVSPNLFNSSTETVGKFINDSGTIVTNANYAYSDFIQVIEGEKYTASLTRVAGSPAGTLRIHAYNSSQVWDSMLFASTSETVATITIPNGIKYVRISWWKAEYAEDRQFEIGSTVTTYRPYGQIYTSGTVETVQDSLSNTATAEILLKVGDYQDVQSIIDGVVTRKVGVKVLDGTEGWTQSAATNNLFYATISNSNTDNTYVPISSHFQGVVASTGYAAMANGQFKHGSNTNSWYFKNIDCANATAFSQYLADQYAAGTPVIVIYPLATATTDSVTGHTLQVQAGANTLEITQASLNGLELEAKYKKTK